MRIRRTFVSMLGCVAAGIYLLALDAPVPFGSAAGQRVGNFGISAPSDPPANFSLNMMAYMEGGALQVEKMEFFHDAGNVPTPILTIGEDGSANIHIWVTRPRFRLVSTKCEFTRTVRFSIPKAELVGVRKLVLINHDTGVNQVLAEGESLVRLLGEREVAPGYSARQSKLSTTGNGCGGS